MKYTNKREKRVEEEGSCYRIKTGKIRYRMKMKIAMT